MQTEDLRHVIEWKALDVGEIALGSKRAETEGLGLFSPAFGVTVTLPGSPSCCFRNCNGLCDAVLWFLLSSQPFIAIPLLVSVAAQT